MLFSETFIETHKNVSILYADICGFTPLTEKFTKKIVNGKEVPIDRIEDLVATLNDLFAKFDDAADVSIFSLIASLTKLFTLLNLTEKRVSLQHITILRILTHIF